MTDKSQYCLTCTNSAEKLVPLSDIEDFHQLFHSVTAINISDEIKLPNQICVACLNQLQEADIFIKKCKTSYEQFMSWEDDSTRIFSESIDGPLPELTDDSIILLDSDRNNQESIDSFEPRENPNSPYRQSDIPIKKRYLSERNDESGKKIRKVLDIEDIVPESEQKKKNGCEGCCLESTNVCLQKINTNLNAIQSEQEDDGCGPQNQNLEESQRQVNFVEDQGYFSSPVDFEEAVELEGMRLGKIVDAEILEEIKKFEEPAASSTLAPLTTMIPSTISTLSPNSMSFSPTGNSFQIPLNPSTFEPSEISDNLQTLHLCDQEPSFAMETDTPLNLKVDTPSLKEPELSDSEDEKPKLFSPKSGKKDSIFTTHCDEPNCKYSFKNEDNKKIHKILYHSNLINESNQCIYCDKKFARKRLLKRHLFLHLKIYHYNCKYCEKSFKLKHQLKNHENIHERSEELVISKARRSKKSDTQPDKKSLNLCQNCNATFSTKSSLKTHLKRCDVMVT